MNKYVKYTMQSLLLTTASLPAFAHPGHSHTDMSSGLMHVLFYGSVLAAAAALTYAVATRTKSSIQSKNQGE